MTATTERPAGPGSPAEAAAIRTTDLRKTYKSSRGDTEAMRGIDLDVAHGEFFGLLGPNGAGKPNLGQRHSPNCLRGNPQLPAYGATKRAVNSITESAATYGQQGIRVNAITPGTTLTEMMPPAGHRGPGELPLKPVVLVGELISYTAQVVRALG